MEMGVGMVHKAKEEIAAADYPEIRLLLVPKTAAAQAAKDVNSKWAVCTPKSWTSPRVVGAVSPRPLYFSLAAICTRSWNVPIGLIETGPGADSQSSDSFLTAKRAATLYNGMIALVKPFAIRGAIWYQGEANVGNGYEVCQRNEIVSSAVWRQVWGYDIPFYFMSRSRPGPDMVLTVRRCSGKFVVASLKIPGTGMVVTTDLVDDIKDIHPKDKVDVGNRLAR